MTCSLCAWACERPEAFRTTNFLACTRDAKSGALRGAILVCADENACRQRRATQRKISVAADPPKVEPRVAPASTLLSERDKYDRLMRGESW